MIALSSGEVALVAGVAKTVIMLTAPANHRVKAIGFSVFFKDVVVTDTPVKIELGRCTTAGTPGSSPSPVKKDDSFAETVLTSGGINFSAEPTYTDIIQTLEIHPQTGIEKYYPLTQEIKIKGGGRLGVRMTAAQAQTVAFNFEAEE